ncbi:MAG TPA: NAD(+) diphosphatase [Caulobacteraceae bacterium]|jgi:NAD+ diphosphatase
MPLDAFTNTFAGLRLDRGGDQRSDAAWLAEQAANPEARALAMWNGGPLVTDAGDRLTWLQTPFAEDAAGPPLLFLGHDGEVPVFAVEFEGEADPAAGPLEGLGRFIDMRGAGAMLSTHEAACAALAKSLLDWRAHHGFCARCGTRSEDAAGGWRRRCPACAAEHFPRVDPVVIMLATHTGADGEPRCLVGRQAAWPPGRMSALAGFLEPGESIEEACARELFEEAGVRAVRVTYHSSQPWPFPSSLMIGLYAEVDSGEARPDQTELEAVRWLTRAEARAVIAGEHPEVGAPPPVAIAHQLIKAWAEG